MPNRTEARPAKAVLTYVTGSLPLLRLFSTPLKTSNRVGRNGLLEFCDVTCDVTLASIPLQVAVNACYASQVD